MPSPPGVSRRGSPYCSEFGPSMSDSADSRAKKTLFVDDDELLRAVMSEVLRDYGYDVVEAGSGREALGLMDASIDLLITDIKLPDMFGNALAAELRQRFPRLPIIFSTGGDGSLPGNASVEDTVMLLKPYDLAAFKQALEHAEAIAI